MATSPKYLSDTAESSLSDRNLSANPAANFRAPRWTPAQLDQLRELWARKPELSAALIAEELGTTRSAVLGQRDRLGLPPRTKGRSKGRKCRPHKPRKSGRVPVSARKPKPVPSAAPTTRVHIVDLKTGMCRFPLEGVFFCGSESDGSFCPWHAKQCYQAS
jgi:hypothetical protein